MEVKDMHPGDKARVISLKKEHPQYRRRLLSFGMTPGAEFEVLRVAPLGDPVEVRVRGSFMSIRRDEASLLVIEPLSKNQ